MITHLFYGHFIKTTPVGMHQKTVTTIVAPRFHRTTYDHFCQSICGSCSGRPPPLPRDTAGNTLRQVLHFLHTQPFWVWLDSDLSLTYISLCVDCSSSQRNDSPHTATTTLYAVNCIIPASGTSSQYDCSMLYGLVVSKAEQISVQLNQVQRWS